MNRLFCLVILLFSLNGSSGQLANPGLTDVVSQSLRAGNAQQLATHFDTNIELIIDSEAIEFQSLQATHAELILKSFFRKYPPRHFQYVYRGKAGHQQYSKGLYQTGREQFQVYVLTNDATASAGGISHYRIKTLHFRKATPDRPASQAVAY